MDASKFDRGLKGREMKSAKCHILEIYMRSVRKVRGLTLLLGVVTLWRCGDIFLLATASRTALGPTQPPIQWVTGRGVKLTTHVHLVPMSRMRGSIPPLPISSSWRGA